MSKQEKATNVFIFVIIITFFLQCLSSFIISKSVARIEGYVSCINIIRKIDKDTSLGIYETHNKYKLHAAALSFYIKYKQTNKKRW